MLDWVLCWFCLLARSVWPWRRLHLLRAFSICRTLLGKNQVFSPTCWYSKNRVEGVHKRVWARGKLWTLGVVWGQPCLCRRVIGSRWEEERSPGYLPCGKGQETLRQGTDFEGLLAKETLQRSQKTWGFLLCFAVRNYGVLRLWSCKILESSYLYLNAGGKRQ